MYAIKIKTSNVTYAALALLLGATMVLAPMLSQKVSALSGSEFKAGRIMDDSVFFNGNAMTATQIQEFMNAKRPDCDTNGQKMIYDPSRGDTVTRKVYAERRGVSTPFTCLKDYKQSTPSKVATSFCKAYTGGTKSSAQIINDVSQSCGVSQKVLLILLQKEQSLVTDDWPWPIQYRSATGYGCPDTAPCDAEYYGFFNQVYMAARVYKYYAAYPNSFNHIAGRDNYVLYNPNHACGGTTVHIENQTTAGLYNYTPYQPNAAALNNLYGTGDGCSAYGNRNFWRMYSDWFGSALGSPFFRIGNTDPVYILGSDNNYYHIASWATMYAYGFGSTVDRIASVDSSYISGRTLTGKLPLTARFEGAEIYLLDEGLTHHFPSREVLEHYGSTIGQEAQLPIWTKFYYPSSTNMERVVKRADGNEVYYMQSGSKRHIIDRDAYASGSPAYSSLSRVVLSSRYISSLPNGAPIMTAGKLVKRSDKHTYGYWDGAQLQNINTHTIQDLGLLPDYTSSSSSIDQLASTTSALNNLAKDSSGQLFILDSKLKFSVIPATLTDLGLANSDFIVTSDSLLSRVPSTPLSKVNRVNGSREVYLIKSGKRYHFTDQDALHESGHTMSQVKNLNTRSGLLFPDSGKIILASGRIFRIGNQAEVYLVTNGLSRVHIPSSTMLSEYGYAFGNVLSFSGSQVDLYMLQGALKHLVKDGENKIWMIDAGNRKRMLPASLADAANYSVNQSELTLLSNRVLASYNTGGDLTNLIQAAGDKKVYKIENGRKRWITSRSAFESNGFVWSNISPVSVSLLNSFPNGDPVY